MLSKKQRLSRTEFSLIYKNGKRVSTPLFYFIYKKADIRSRYSVVVSKKVSKSAVTRHKIKRRVYSILSEYIKQNSTHIYDGIFIISPQITKEPVDTIKQTIIRTLDAI